MKRNRPYPHFKFPDEIQIGYTKMKDSDCRWFGVPAGSYELRTLNYSWFPTQSIMGVIDGKFSDTNKIGAHISGNMGSAGIAVTNIDKAIQLLSSAGYSITEVVPITD